jgi:hypothetical protein
MRSVTVALALAAGTVLAQATPVFAEDTIPCEQKLSTVREALKTATLDDAKKSQADALMAKGIERCNADDDARADAFFAQVEALLAK